MKTLGTTLVTLAAAAAVSACGSGNSASTSSSAAASPASTPTTSSPQASAASSSGSASPGTGASAGSASAVRRLGTRTQHVLTQMAAATGQLATGRSASEQQARAALAQAQAKANHLSVTAAAKLPASSPARPLIVDTTREAATTAGHLRTMKLTSQTRQTLTTAQARLSMLAGEVGIVRVAPQQATVTQITSTLKSLMRDVTAPGSSH